MNGTVCKVRMRACSNASVFVPQSQLDCSAWTSVLTFTPVALSPALTNLEATARGGRVILSWTAPSGLTIRTSRYEIQYGEHPSGDATRRRMCCALMVSLVTSSRTMPIEPFHLATPPGRAIHYLCCGGA